MNSLCGRLTFGGFDFLVEEFPATLEEVVEHYVQGGTPNTNLSKDILKLDLSPQDKADLVEFMKACSGPLPEVEQGRLPQ